ncbi:MAG: ATP-binding protein [Chlamydiia bacterium]|nr:ATP-binding protein [Chlamydiia bacterium]
MKRYIRRTIEAVLTQAVEEFPAVVLTGPRQAGKTTLLKHLFGDRFGYVSLEPPDVRAAAMADPRGFLDLHPSPVIFDEVQYAPELLFYIKEKIDQNRDQCGQYLLTGSQNILLSQHVTESLAGRAAILKLLPLSFVEIMGKPDDPFYWEGKKNDLPLSSVDFWEGLLRGSFPELIQNPNKGEELWLGGYLQTYLERDVRTLRQIGDLSQFQLFLKALAARSGQLLQLTDIAKDIGVAVNTVKAWVSILEATYQIIILRPYFKNTNKRLVKSPKVYFTDVGMLCYLLGLKDRDHLRNGPMAGSIVETFIVTEVYKRLVARGKEPQIYFWRTSSGNEVDLIIEDQGLLIPIEIKGSATPRPAMAKGISCFQEDHKDQTKKGYVVFLGDIPLPLAPDVLALPFSSL